MRSRRSPQYVALALSAMLAFVLFLVVSRWRAFSLVITALGVAGAWTGPRIRLPWPLVLAIALLVGAPFMLLTGDYYEKTYFLAASAMAAAVACAVCQCLLLVRLTPVREELLVVCFPLCFSMAAAVSFELPALPTLGVALVQVLLLAVGLRLRAGGVFSWLALASFLPSILIAGALAVALQWSETKVNMLMTLFQPSINTAFTFQHSSRLSFIPQRSPMVVLRIFGPNPPQSLVGRCYSSYHKGRWDAPNTTRPLLSAGESKFWLSTRHEELNEFDTIESGSQNALFLPRDGMRLLIGVPQVLAAFGNTCEVRGGWTNQGVYQVARVLHQTMPTAQDESEAAECLALPMGLDPIVSQLAHDWTVNCTKDVDRANVLTNYFQDHFKYGYSYPFERHADPVPEFLKKRPPAHCELFATSLALMLRTLGIPSRYINGFVCKERNTEFRFEVLAGSQTGSYSPVRVRDAHAWVEGWIGKRWVRLDPTPPLELAPPSGPSAWLERLSETLRYYGHKLLHLSPQEALAAAAALLRRRGPLLFVLGALYLLLRYARRFLREPRAQRERAARAAVDETLPRLLATVEAEARTGGLVRSPDLTLERWASHLESSHPMLVGFLRDYGRMRYGQSDVTEHELARLQAALDAAVREIRTLREAARREGQPPPR